MLRMAIDYPKKLVVGYLLIDYRLQSEFTFAAPHAGALLEKYEVRSIETHVGMRQPALRTRNSLADGKQD